MTSTWVAKNPTLNIRNQALSVPMSDAEFEDCMRSIVHDSGDYDAKLELLLNVKGFVNGEQAGLLLSIFQRPKDKLKAVMILEPKLISMSCQEARSILGSLSIPEDRLTALHYVKRALYDTNTQEGIDNIVSTFTFAEHKITAARVLSTVVGKKGIQIAAGGHQGYAPLGTLYTNATPNNPHIYGHPLLQAQHLPHHKLVTDNINEKNSMSNPKYPSSIYKSNLPENVNLSTYAKANDYPGNKAYLNANKCGSTYY